jgi:hypothetical protein
MIDFKNGKIFKLAKADNDNHIAMITPLLVDGEHVIAQFSAVRDFVIFTNKRIITVNVQGLSGKKKDFTSLPYSKVQAFSIETAGTFDLDAELELSFSGLGSVKLDFSNATEIYEIGRMISEHVL